MLPGPPPGLHAPLTLGDWCQLVYIGMHPSAYDGSVLMVFHWFHQDGTIEVVSFSISIGQILRTALS